MMVNSKNGMREISKCWGDPHNLWCKYYLCWANQQLLSLKGVSHNILQEIAILLSAQFSWMPLPGAQEINFEFCCATLRNSDKYFCPNLFKLGWSHWVNCEDRHPLPRHTLISELEECALSFLPVRGIGRQREYLIYSKSELCTPFVVLFVYI